MFLSALLLSSLIGLASSQCTGNDAPQCNSWVTKANFCSNTGYTMEMRKQYCGVRCGFCNTDGTQTAAGGGSNYGSCVDKNANCAAWAKTGFCTNPSTSNSMKLLYCCSTCRPTVLFGTSTTASSGASGSTTVTGSTTTATTTTTVAPGGKRK